MEPGIGGKLTEHFSSVFITEKKLLLENLEMREMEF